MADLGTGTSGTMVQGAGNGNSPTFSTATWPSTTTINNVLYSTSNNAVGQLAATNNAALTSNASGVPTWKALTDGQVIIGSSSGAPAAATLTAGSNITITNAANSITIASSGGGGTTLTSVKVTLTNAQLRAWNGTPVQLVAAQGPGTIILPLQITARLNYGGNNPFTGGGGGVFIGLGSAGITCINMGSGWTYSANAFYYGGCPNFYSNGVTIESVSPDTNVVNQPLQVSSNGNMTGNAANDNTISFYITYIVTTI